MIIEGKADLLVMRAALARHVKQRRRDSERLSGRANRAKDIATNANEVRRGERMLKDLNSELRRGS